MSAFFLALGSAWIVLVALLVLVLVVQVLAGWRQRPSAATPRSGPLPSYVVLMPAHNEAGTITAPIQSLSKQLSPGARLLVVADNCSDATAAEARAAGAEVVERHDPSARGKGHALAFGLAHLAADPPDVVLVIDADCTASGGTPDLLAATAMDRQRPVQALDLMLAPAGSSLRVRMAAFAWALRNQVRPSGMHRLGLPCQLMGTGMAFPWSCIRSNDFASSHLAEDMQLGLKLALEGRAPEFCPAARVESWFPQEAAALEGQRKRWVHGHLSLITAVAPLLWRSLRTRNAAAVAVALDVCVPPLALLALLVVLACGVGAWTAGQGPLGSVAAAVAGLSLLGFATAVLLAWLSVGRQWVSFGELASAPVYVLRKLPIYAGFLFNRQKEWIRTSRQR